MTQSELYAKLQLAGITIERDSISRIEIGTRFVTDYEIRDFDRHCPRVNTDLIENCRAQPLGCAANAESVVRRKPPHPTMCFLS